MTRGERPALPAGMVFLGLIAGVIGWMRWAPDPFGPDPGDLTGTWRAADGSTLELRAGGRTVRITDAAGWDCHPAGAAEDPGTPFSAEGAWTYDADSLPDPHADAATREGRSLTVHFTGGRTGHCTARFVVDAPAAA
ncbi:hypothetical protein ACIQU4_10390 [Streptomyces sp. NPDC090741]|uniref:hypothetical protein n=1 Tax=Streptomyces sp. NPDC090741 TaxID=3365967 RepID=UPI00380F6927